MLYGVRIPMRFSEFLDQGEHGTGRSPPTRSHGISGNPGPQCCNAAMHPPTYRHIAHHDKSDECRPQPVGGSHVPLLCLPPQVSTL
ncbi:uncharacterized protein CCOS01_14158 [Colletotrichum costaricense]|uniref:Uncharacterized protein n=1 Tax=Colletotrichum costaricense TaxID=1209916 RepID=A0AAI9YK79_9PEZI|nr:uncharacterized protein CCOS01_14158 [Colletotrichum costaricense]KAK1514218.1 hypothetical protein CCOS01_14158 [Colletotrichum costaricense]